MESAFLDLLQTLRNLFVERTPLSGRVLVGFGEMCRALLRMQTTKPFANQSAETTVGLFCKAFGLGKFPGGQRDGNGFAGPHCECAECDWVRFNRNIPNIAGGRLPLAQHHQNQTRQYCRPDQ